MSGTSTPGNVKLTAYFIDPAAVRVPVTVVLFPEGSYSGIAPKTIPTFTGATFQNSWAQVVGAQPVGYMKDAFTFLHLRGQVSNALVPVVPSTIFTLPVGYRPGKTSFFAVEANNAYGRVNVQSDGQVIIAFGSTAGGVSLDGINFVAEA
jgi:hypothetical protein